MAIKGLEQAVENLSRISKTAVPGAAAMAISQVTQCYDSPPVQAGFFVG
ncbi:prophage minor tail Z family protein [Escherichia coli 4-203-08_S1_C1]|nr:minor tail protein Z (GpZ) [Escherichia coli 1303]EYD88686.1 prophage minor tail Z family protein [Escherichia coli 1-176-05_S1_C1]EZK08711.1 prophage minor tail Z family protein [Escherichia coli 1-176-05_S1_C3]EZK21339.1 prophage minor tail Z family protein [Escherichia coli 1-176-05_S1_C2]KDU60485.1 prophage minor tail Z family protein [Escherichia coli 4-203-08_S1_C1]KEK91832.1 prophage minor tail Z family protein [Escherichia coli 4-203-08_S1_C2]KEK96882.1 prophage minor tail Z family